MRPLKSCIWPIKQQWMVSCWLHSFECLATMGPKIIWSWIWISKFKSWKYSKCLNVPKILQDVSHNSITSKVERAKKSREIIKWKYFKCDSRFFLAQLCLSFLGPSPHYQFTTSNCDRNSAQRIKGPSINDQLATQVVSIQNPNCYCP